MNVEQFEVPGLAHYSYIVSSGHEAIVIDPIRDFDRYIPYASERGLTIKVVTETHIHADFSSGALALADAVKADLALSAHDAGEHYRYSMRHRQLRDGDEMQVGSARLQALHTPGHTPEHLSFILFDGERSQSEPVAIFTGDFLFVGSLGRPDLLGDDEKQRLAKELYRSLHRRIQSLPGGVQLYPGHGAGSFCGSGMSERAESTLGYERATQSLFKLPESEFVQEILASVPPMPSYYPRMKKLNAEGALSIAKVPQPQRLSPAEFRARLDENSVVLDLRSPEVFGDAHLPGAINIGAGQNLSLWAGWLLDPAKAIFLVSDCGDDEASRRALMRVGLDKIEGFLANGMSAWIEAGFEFARTPQLSVDAVHLRDPATMVLDVRSQKEWDVGHIENARHIALGDLSERIAQRPSGRPIIAVCGSGYRASIAASLLQQHGFTRISNLDGGMAAWNRRGLPTVMT
jgi:hydroxyacylglutathione hydrolase